MRVTEESEKASLKLNIQKMKIMASRPIISWQIYGKTIETENLFSWAPKSLQTVTTVMKLKHMKLKLASYKRCYDKPRQHVKKQRHHFANKVCLVKAIVFPVVYGCESWTIKKVEHQRIHAFELWHWRRLLRVP